MYPPKGAASSDMAYRPYHPPSPGVRQVLPVTRSRPSDGLPETSDIIQLGPGFQPRIQRPDEVRPTAGRTLPPPKIGGGGLIHYPGIASRFGVGLPTTPQQGEGAQSAVTGSEVPFGFPYGQQASNLARITATYGVSATNLGSLARGHVSNIRTVPGYGPSSAPVSPRPSSSPRPRPQPFHERTHVETQTSFQSTVSSPRSPNEVQTPTPTKSPPQHQNQKLNPVEKFQDKPHPRKSQPHVTSPPLSLTSQPLPLLPTFSPVDNITTPNSGSPPSVSPKSPQERRISRRKTLFDYDTLKNAFCLSCPPVGLDFTSSMAAKYYHHPHHADDKEVSASQSSDN